MTQPNIKIRFLRIFTLQNWIRRSLRFRVHEKIRSDELFTVPFYNLTWSGQLNNYIEKIIYFFGAHEREYLEASKHFLKPGSVVIDAGANIGNHSIFYSQHVSWVFAFEPDPKLANNLIKRLSDLGVNNVTVVDKGLGKEAGMLNYNRATGDNKGIGSFIPNFHPQNVSIGEIEIISGDQFVISNNIKGIDFIKIDTEGSDQSVIIGFLQTIMKERPIIQLEYAKNYWSDSNSLVSLLPNYTIRKISVNRNLFVFNSARAKLTSLDENLLRAELFLIPDEKLKSFKF
jgi:FkbM family methyltransferase